MRLADFEWRPLPEIEPRLQEVLHAWDRTPYHAGWQAPGLGVDCVRFVCGVLDALHGTSTPLATLPPDAAMHDPKGAARTMRLIRKSFPEHETIRSGHLEPGDVIVAGPAVGGPGHAMIAGYQRNTIWHSTGIGVQRTGLGFVCSYHSRVFRIYRHKDKRSWLS